MDCMLYLAIGDSLTYGHGVHPDKSFPAQLCVMAEKALGRKVRFYNGGIVGATANDTADLLETDAKLSDYAGRADLITVTVGGNDLLHAARAYYAAGDRRLLTEALRTFLVAVRRIVAAIEQARTDPSKPYAVRFLNLYNPFPEIDEATFWINRLNKHLRRIQRPHIQVVSLQEAFEGRMELLSDDMVHPTEDGYFVMAQLTDQVGYSPLS